MYPITIDDSVNNLRVINSEASILSRNIEQILFADEVNQSKMK